MPYRFRIVLMGLPGVGKFSLVQSIFNGISIDDLAGADNIERAYTFKGTTRLVLHLSDFNGYGLGSVDNWDTLAQFLLERSKMKVADRVHVLWLCILTPMEGMRLQGLGDEKVISLAKELNIPLIVVFTKYDQLVDDTYLRVLRKKRSAVDLSESLIERRARNRFDDRIRGLPQMKVPIVKVSISEDYAGSSESLLELTKLTRKCLGDTEEVPFIIAQRVDTSQKVELSIREGLKKYWCNLGNSTFFQGRMVKDCVSQIHDDIVIVWNFEDPGELLSGEKFRAKIIALVSPILEGSEAEIPQDDAFSMCLNVAAFVLIMAGTFVPLLTAAGVSLLGLKFLYGTYKKMWAIGDYFPYRIMLTPVWYY